MRTSCTWGLLAVLLAANASITYFKYDRQVETANSSGQYYAIVDDSIWQHSRPDLVDLRLYSAEKEIPYVLAIEWGSSQNEQRPIRVLQPGTVGGKTQFLLEMSGISNYNRIVLELEATNFVAHAQVEGQDDPHGTQWVNLGTTTLYDLSDEKLGHNSTLQIPETTYKYLRVTVEGPVKPSDVASATAGMTREQKAVWRDVNNDFKLSQTGKDTVLTFSATENIPVERVTIEIEPGQRNFRRGIEILGDKDVELEAGELCQIHMQRNGQKIDVDHTWLDVRGTIQGVPKVVIHNGDDAPLKITGARLQQYERRIYFESDAAAPHILYYGDDRLGAPNYDYAALFQKDANASVAKLGPEEKNASYTGRPDGRPWSERHPAMLWVAIAAAILILGGIALRSIKSATT